MLLRSRSDFSDVLALVDDACGIYFPNKNIIFYHILLRQRFLSVRVYKFILFILRVCIYETYRVRRGGGDGYTYSHLVLFIYSYSYNTRYTYFLDILI